MNILTTVKSAAFNGYMKLRKISPELALAGGIVCGVGAVVMAVVATKKVVEDDIIGQAHQELNDIAEAAEKYDSVNVKKESLKVYGKTALKIGKTYAPAIGLTALSIALECKSHGILKTRYLDTVAYANGLSEAFKGYRERVSEVVGDEAEKVLMSGGKAEKNIKVEQDDGEIAQMKGSNLVIKDHRNGPYDFDFNRHTAKLTWDPCPDYSEAFLRAQQSYFNDIFVARGHVFLNEVLDALGLERTQAGAVCGWVKGMGDDIIDFGYMDSFIRDYNTDSDLCRKNIHLSFNCDGVIWDKI